MTKETQDTVQNSTPAQQAKSGRDVGKEYLNSFLAYLDRTPDLPTTQNGLINVAAIAEETGIPRQSFYKNPGISDALEGARSRMGQHQKFGNEDGATPNIVAPGGTPALPSDKKAKALERKITQLEQQNAALVAENAELRRQVKAIRLQAGRVDMMIETGRRIPPSSNPDE